MWFKHRAWIPVAWLLCLGNLISVWFAARPAEPWHATIHALLAVLFGLGAQRLAARPDSRRRQLESEELQMLEDLQTRLGELNELKQRIGELEDRVDFAERLLAKQREGQRLGPPQG